MKHYITVAENWIWKRFWICRETDCKTNEIVMEVSTEKAK